MNLAEKAVLPHGAAMDRIYRGQRHFYDVTRKYYLLGRDEMLANLAVPPGGQVLEIGCGTARNLIKAAEAYPGSRLYGIDISEQMLLTAGHSISRAGLHERVRLACGDACGFDAARLFGSESFERVYFSYTLSMIPDWRRALAAAAGLLAPGGQLHIVDFGDCGRLPGMFRSGLWWWLKQFEVEPRLELAAALLELAAARGLQAKLRRRYRGYAVLGVLMRPA